MEDLIKYLAGDLVAKLNQLEEETNFEHLTAVGDADIASEAQFLHEEIIKLKTRLQQL